MSVMKSTGGVLFLVLVLALLVGCGPGQPALSPLSDGSVILAFGDSLTHGTGAEPEQSYPVVLEALSGRRVIESGVPGEQSDAGLERLPQVLADSAPDLVILGHGGNDMLRRRNLDRTVENLTEMARLVRATGAEVVLLGVPKPGLFLGTHPMYDRLAETLQAPLERDVIADVLSDSDLKSDTIHPNAEGYRRVAEALQRLLVEAGAL